MCEEKTYERFQSTHPVRGATAAEKSKQQAQQISIHAPREGCDSASFLIDKESIAISIHAPREGCDITACPKNGGHI